MNKTMGVMEAFEKSLKTWKSWVLEKLDPDKSYVFFRSYSPVHYRLGHIQIKVVIPGSSKVLNPLLFQKWEMEFRWSM